MASPSPATALPAPALPSLPTTLDEANRLTEGQWQSVFHAPAAKAAKWITAVARLGHPMAQAVRGQWLLDGHGMPRNAADALVWFLKAAEQGHAMGMNMAGRCYENGWGASVDSKLATEWFRKAADAGLDAGMYNYANQLASGEAVAKDPGKAFDLYSAAATLGNAKAMTKVGRFHEDGLVVPRSLEKAFHCYRLGAEGGDFRGQFNYAGMLAAQGQREEALEWLRKVPLTATPSFKQQAGALLMKSHDKDFQDIGRAMAQTTSDQK